MTPAQQIAGYLKLTRAHYYLNGRHSPSPCLALRSLIAFEMESEILFIAIDLKNFLEYDEVAA
jgi:hypothetical protein